MNGILPGKNSNKINYLLLIIIISIAAILRFYNFFNIPYIGDEFGVVYWSRFNSVHDLVLKLIVFDGHPAGITILSYYWMKLGGINPYWLKLPFVLCGLFSVYLVWLIGRKWYNNTVGYD